MDKRLRFQPSGISKCFQTFKIQLDHLLGQNYCGNLHTMENGVHQRRMVDGKL